MGLVSQDPVFFKGSIRANIANVEEGIANEMETIAASKLQMHIDLLLAYNWLVEQNILLNSSQLSNY
jgi:ABC-type bacteriocin/lantibiotic exporter with double-glycine peptidase domain